MRKNLEYEIRGPLEYELYESEVLYGGTITKFYQNEVWCGEVILAHDFSYDFPDNSKERLFIEAKENFEKLCKQLSVQQWPQKDGHRSEE